MGLGQRADSPWDINTHRRVAKVASDLADSAASHQNTQRVGREVIFCKNQRGVKFLDLWVSAEPMHFLPVVTASDSSVHAPFASELGCSKLVFWLSVVFPSWISCSVICELFIAAGAKYNKN